MTKHNKLAFIEWTALASELIFDRNPMQEPMTFFKEVFEESCRKGNVHHMPEMMNDTGHITTLSQPYTLAVVMRSNKPNKRIQQNFI